ncbi:MAG: hypothetical protein KF751_10630 [Nitrospira sp.]|nr:hypothetical protein [Nitrospira sp.]
MTIAISIRTGSAVVFAADSKVTTRGIAGLEEDGTPRWQDQTYDNAFKVVHDRSQKLMVMVAGDANLGQMLATDFIATRSFTIDGDAETQDKSVAGLAEEMFKEIEAVWSKTKMPPEQWPGPILLLAAPSPDGKRPRVWRIVLYAGKAEVQEIQNEPGIRMEGSYNAIFPLLYGFDYSVLSATAKDLGIEIEVFAKSLQSLKVLRPIDKLNFYPMPIQDAMEFAVFLAKCQVEMERFLPGTPLCGGPIDVMVLQMAPEARIQSYPGKSIRHPHAVIQR